MSFFICRTYPSHLDLSFIIVLEGEFEPPFSYSQQFKMRSVSRVPRTIRRQFLWKTSSKSSSASGSAPASEPYLTTVITIPSNILILVCRLIFLFFKTFFLTEKTPWVLPIQFLTSLLLPAWSIFSYPTSPSCFDWFVSNFLQPAYAFGGGGGVFGSCSLPKNPIHWFSLISYIFFVAHLFYAVSSPVNDMCERT